MDVCKQLEGVSPNNETGAFNGCSPATIPDTVTAIDLVRYLCYRIIFVINT